MSVQFVKFAVIVDGDVVSNISLADDEHNAMQIAAFRTGITYVEIDTEIQPGSTWDGKTFHPPAQ